MTQKLRTGQVFPCPCGGSYNAVTESRGRSAGWVYRIRTCADCGGSITTREVTADQLAALRRDSEVLQAVRETLQAEAHRNGGGK